MNRTCVGLVSTVVNMMVIIKSFFNGKLFSIRNTGMQICKIQIFHIKYGGGLMSPLFYGSKIFVHSELLESLYYIVYDELRI